MKFKIERGMKVRFVGTGRNTSPRYKPGDVFEIEGVNDESECLNLLHHGRWSFDTLFSEFVPADEPFPDRTVPVFVAPGYDSLFIVLTRALEQAQAGKGKERHAGEGQAFEDQPIIQIGNLTGMGFQTGQAIKKAVEAQRMVTRGHLAAAEREMLGAINYLATACIEINKRATADMKEE